MSSLSNHVWKHTHLSDSHNYSVDTKPQHNLLISTCQNSQCNKICLWVDSNMEYPKILSNIPPHLDTPLDVAELYEEARKVSNDSPRASAALLRVALEKLTEHLGECTGDLNTRIGSLKKKGLSETVIMSLDSVRIFGNEAGAHSGQIDLSGKDNLNIVSKLFWLINYIVEKTITDPREIGETFDLLPENKKQGIKNRDNN